MKRDFSAEIVELLTPRPVPSEWRWERAEAEIGARIPSDYKALIAALGGGGVLDDCLGLFEPDSRMTESDIAKLVAERDTVWPFLKDRGYRTLPAKYFVEGVRLIPFAMFEAHYFYWIAVSGRPEDEWGVLFVDADFEDWLEFDMSATEFIYNLLSGQLKLWVFEEYFLDPPYDYVQ
ncbi:SMI1/KNR4 family protein [Actinoplanes regularis]|uniref:SMI1/KNR4 family protein n=1 Tax=Actinoplanes regularis TaxID=52697 RepID=UPI0024A5D739|nr:SMI1/KNR4 family protein [Actinoplanes regularis]GLW30821.1 hypothetical protein Areg01_37610 [Actinoplanes regularis]